MTSLVKVAGLRVRYGSAGEALSGIDLVMAPGERLAVIGESGSGKSTLALAIAGLLPQTARIAGRIDFPALGRRPRHGADIGFVFQDPSASLDPVMTVGNQVAEVAAAHLGLTRGAARNLSADLFGTVGLPDPRLLLDAYPHQLSGGQKQRVSIAAAIAAKPALLIADEPTSALDTLAQADILRLIDRLVGESGMAMLLVSHDIALAAGFADRLAVMKDGVIVEQGAALDLVRRPRTAYLGALLDACLTLDGDPMAGA